MRKAEIYGGAALAASFFFGGAARVGAASDAVPQLLSLPILVLLAPQLPAIFRGRAGPLALLAFIVAIPLIQLIPLPPAVWEALPGRSAQVEVFRVAGIAPSWLPISMSPWATIRVALSLLPPVAVFLGFLACDVGARMRLWAVILAVGFLSILLNAAQMVDGPDSILRFHALASKTESPGFFANRNHNAAFLYLMIPVAALLFERAPARYRPQALAGLIGFYVLNFLGLMTTGSKSALLLGVAAHLLSYTLVLRRGGWALAGRKTWALLGVLGGLVLTSLLALSFGLLQILDRFQTDIIVADYRWKIARLSVAAIKEFFPVGSGLGTFERVFPRFEPTRDIIPAVVNHAHNDWIELLIETGAFGLVALAGFFALTAACLVRNFQDSQVSSQKERAAAFIVVALLLIHSLWDYPLRTEALMMLFAACCATLATAFGEVRKVALSPKVGMRSGRVASAPT